MCLIFLLAYKRNQRIFIGKKQSVAFVSGHLFTFLVFFSLICLVTTQILICENQTILRLKILLRTIVAALLITKCNGRFFKNKRCQETGKEYFTIVEMIVKEQYLMPDYAKPSHPPPHKHTHTNKKDTVCLMISAHPTPPFFGSHHK